MEKTEIKEIQTYDEFEQFCTDNNLNSIVEIGGRGGTLGVYGDGLATAVGINEGSIPSKVGAYCNYLGGGLRGSIVASNGFASHGVPEKEADLLDEFSAMCKRVYENVENDNGMNEETDEDGETNWEALGTNKSRNAGIVSAY